MKQIYKILMFTIFLHLTMVFVASIGIFGSNVFYGDMFTKNVQGKTDEETVNTMLMVDNKTNTVPIIGDMSFKVIMGAFFIGSIAAAFFLRGNTTVISGAIISGAFLVMWVNSKGIIDQILTTGGANLVYVGTMIGVGMLILFVIEVRDIASGQQSD